jgi:predicted nucleotidyltransferase
VRLTAEEAAAIRSAACETFGADVAVRLFGSRIDDTARGGDIDLLIDVAPGHAGVAFESRFLDRLFTRIDEQKVDVVLVERGRPVSAFAAMVATHAVALP